MKRKPIKNILLIWGDWSRKKQMKGCIPMPCIGLKRRVNEELKIMDLNEFRTSCLDSKTLEKNKNVEIINNNNKKKELHSVLVSKILENGECKLRYQNRNRNAVDNFKLIVDHYKNYGLRKQEFSRTTKLKTDTNNNVEKIKNILISKTLS